MAKLSANGTEILRMKRVTSLEVGVIRTIEVSFRSNGAMLRKSEWKHEDASKKWLNGGTGWKRVIDTRTGKFAKIGADLLADPERLKAAAIEKYKNFQVVD